MQSHAPVELCMLVIFCGFFEICTIFQFKKQTSKGSSTDIPSGET